MVLLCRHKGKPTKTLLASLHTTSEKLKKYSHVNKKAMDQYATFTEQRTTLGKRKEELDESAKVCGRRRQSGARARPRPKALAA